MNKKIKRITIRDIGKLKNLSLELGENLNVVFAENGAGKTTLTKAVQEIIFEPKTVKEILESVETKYFKGEVLNLYFNKDSRTTFTFTDNSKSILTFKQNEFSNMQANFKGVPVLCELDFMQNEVLNQSIGGLQQLDKNSRDYAKLNAQLKFRKKISDEFSSLLDKPRRKENFQDRFKKWDPISFDVFNKDMDITIENIKGISTSLILLRLVIYSLFFKKLEIKEKLNYIHDVALDVKRHQIEIINWVKSDEYNYEDIKEWGEELLFCLDEPINEIMKNTPENAYIKASELEQEIKKTQALLKKRKIHHTDMANFINEELKHHPLGQNILINSDLSILPTSSKTKDIALSTAEARLLTILIFLFNNKNESTIIIDDPITSMDQSNIFFTRDLIFKHAKAGQQILLLTHNYNFLQKFFNLKGKDEYAKMYILENKRDLKNNKNKVSIRKVTNIKSSFQEITDELEHSESIWTTPPLIRQGLEVLVNTFNGGNHIGSLFDVANNEITFLGVTHKFKIRITVEMVHDFTHTQSLISQTRYNNKTFIDDIKQEFLSFFNEIIKRTNFNN